MAKPTEDIKLAIQLELQLESLNTRHKQAVDEYKTITQLEKRQPTPQEKRAICNKIADIKRSKRLIENQLSRVNDIKFLVQAQKITKQTAKLTRSVVGLAGSSLREYKKNMTASAALRNMVTTYDDMQEIDDELNQEDDYKTTGIPEEIQELDDIYIQDLEESMLSINVSRYHVNSTQKPEENKER